MKKLLVPVDGSSHSMLAVEKARQLATAFESDVVLVTVGERGAGGVVDYPSSPYKFSQDQKERAKKELYDRQAQTARVLDAAAGCLDKIPGRLETAVLEGNPAEAILEFAERGKFDLIIMGSKGMTGLQNIFIGSVTRQVALRTSCPILIVR
jgi:nucleotide-binding universal stress UspA family protein